MFLSMEAGGETTEEPMVVEWDMRETREDAERIAGAMSVAPPDRQPTMYHVYEVRYVATYLDGIPVAG
jgi:hypothetical protein